MVRAGYFSIQSTTSHARLATGSLTVMAAFAKNFRMTDSYCKARCPLPSLIAMCLNNSRPSASLTLTPLQETWYRVGMAVDLRRESQHGLVGQCVRFQLARPKRPFRSPVATQSALNWPS